MPRTPSVSSTYLDLVKRFPLRSIRTEAELDAATEVLHDLLQKELNEDGAAYLDALTDLIEVYEARAHPIPDASEADVLRLLMESSGLSQSGLARAVGVAQSTVSEVLKGARSLTKEQVVTLAAFFHVSPAVFLPAPLAPHVDLAAAPRTEAHRAKSLPAAPAPTAPAAMKSPPLKGIAVKKTRRTRPAAPAKQSAKPPKREKV